MAETLGAASKPKKTKVPKDNVVPMKPNAGTVKTGEPIPNAPPEEVLRSTLLRGVADLRDLDEKIATAMSKVKILRSDRKAVTAKMGAAGLPASLIAEAMADADNSRTDMAEKEKARDFIRDVFGLARADYLNSFDGMPTGAVEEVDWEARGYTAGVMAAERDAPKECPPERHQAYFKGYDRVMEARALSMTGGKKKAGPVEDLEEVPLSLVILSEDDFSPDTALEDASTVTATDAGRESIASVQKVIVRFGNRQRVLKEPGYLDDGTDEAGVSEIEDVADTAAAFS